MSPAVPSARRRLIRTILADDQERELLAILRGRRSVDPSHTTVTKERYEPLNTKYETGMQSGSRRKPKLLAGLGVTCRGCGWCSGIRPHPVLDRPRPPARHRSAIPLPRSDGSSPQSPQPPTQSVSPVEAKSRGTFGTILVTASGATLYRYTPDKPNMPTCTGSCAMAWPPDLLPAGSTSIPSGWSHWVG